MLQESSCITHKQYGEIMTDANISVVIPASYKDRARALQLQDLLQRTTNLFDIRIKTVPKSFGHRRARIAKARNVGAQKSFADNADYVLFLDADVFVAVKEVNALTAYVRAEKPKGVLGFFIKEDGTLGKTIGARYNQQMGNPEDDPARIGAMGDCLLVDRTTFHMLDGFSEEFTRPVEFLDLCLRSHLRGYGLSMIPRSVMTYTMSYRDWVRKLIFGKAMQMLLHARWWDRYVQDTYPSA